MGEDLDRAEKLESKQMGITSAVLANLNHRVQGWVGEVGGVLLCSDGHFWV